MTQITRDFTRAVYTFDAVVHRVPDDKWDSDSTCEGWTLRDVLKHQCGVLDALTEVLRTGEMVPPRMAEEADNPIDRWHQTRDALLSTVDDISETPGALAKEGKYWFGPMSLEQLIAMVQWDPLTHAWDIGSAVGIATCLPEDLAQQSFDRVKNIEEFARKHKLIGTAVTVSDEASITDRFLGYIGRQL